MMDLQQKNKKFIFTNKFQKWQITQGSPHRRVPDMKKTLKFTKIKKFTSLNQGLSKTFRWYQNKI